MGPGARRSSAGLSGDEMSEGIREEGQYQNNTFPSLTEETTATGGTDPFRGPTAQSVGLGKEKASVRDMAAEKDQVGEAHREHAMKYPKTSITADEGDDGSVKAHKHSKLSLKRHSAKVDDDEVRFLTITVTVPY